MEHRGSYQRIGETMKALKDWIDSAGIEQSGYPFCLFYDNPRETQADVLRSEACIPISKPFEVQGEIKPREFPEMLVAETRHTGAASEFAITYGPFLEGLLRSGYRTVGPAREYFMTVSDFVGPGGGFLIQQPVEKERPS